MNQRSEPLTDLTAKCIRCGFCLESCPTFVLSGDETQSPRGRITLVRQADEGTIPWSEIREPLDTCLGCRACETACPSGVRYGAILEEARHHLPMHGMGRLALEVGSSTRAIRLLQSLGLTRAPAAMGGVSIRPRESLVDESPRPPDDAEPVCLHTGCAMRAVFPGVLEACRRLVVRAGRRPIDAEQCCGALHAHSGHESQGGTRLRQLVAGVPAGGTLVSPSAGCGSFLKEHSEVRVLDVSEFLVEARFTGRLAEAPHAPVKVAYHEACHLVHAQHVSAGPRALIQSVPGIQLVELNEATMCCGSAGIYNAVQPEIAGQLLDRKWKNIESANPDIVVLGNPGCHGWIAQGGRDRSSRVRVLHLAEFVELALLGRLAR